MCVRVRLLVGLCIECSHMPRIYYVVRMQQTTVRTRLQAGPREDLQSWFDGEQLSVAECGQQPARLNLPNFHFGVSGVEEDTPRVDADSKMRNCTQALLPAAAFEKEAVARFRSKDLKMNSAIGGTLIYVQANRTLTCTDCSTCGHAP